MLKQLAYIIAGMFENAANMIYDAIDMNPHAEPELYISREAAEHMHWMQNRLAEGVPVVWVMGVANDERETMH